LTFDFDLQTRQIQQACSRRRVDEDVEIAAFGIFAAHHAPKDARIRHPRFEHKLANGLPVLR
jgi:hypothetical protein